MAAFGIEPESGSSTKANLIGGRQFVWPSNDRYSQWCFGFVMSQKIRDPGRRNH
jgi:hypothetical protein